MLVLDEEYKRSDLEHRARYVWDSAKLAWIETTEPAKQKSLEDVPAEGRSGVEEVVTEYRAIYVWDNTKLAWAKVPEPATEESPKEVPVERKPEVQQPVASTLVSKKPIIERIIVPKLVERYILPATRESQPKVPTKSRTGVQPVGSHSVANEPVTKETKVAKCPRRDA